MILQGSPAIFYNKRIEALTSLIGEQKRRSTGIAWLRLLVVLATAIAVYISWTSGWLYITLILTVGFAIFLKLVALSTKLNHEIANLQTLLSINRQEIDILEGHYTHRPDGSNLEPPHHAYARDLDIFGKASLFQFIHRTTSEQGHKLLADWLLNAADHATIASRQAAVKELKDQPEWRQQLQAYGTTNPLTRDMQTSLSNWLAQPQRFATKPVWTYLRFILPGISLTFLILYIFEVIQPQAFYSFLILALGASSYISKLVTPQYVQLSKHITQLETLSQSLQWIQLTSASSQVRALKKILDRMDYRLNPLVFIPLNILLYWDLQQVLQLERWKHQQQNKIHHWFEAVAEKEALSSLANLSFNHPAWVFPVIRPDWFTLVCHNTGHPLIAACKCVTNNFEMQGHPQLAFITGSNMAGKSTFLRTIGINLVLAMAGAPVYATRFETPVLKLMTSMRVTDNLEESASTFYAELQKLKMILDEVRNPSASENGTASPRIFLLLDEILRGTNSLDRHTGSEALIKQLIKEHAVGIIASHDLSLAQLEEQFPNAIRNYHFDVTIHGSELSFDYRLKDGVCQTLNATLLMKKIGIDL
ncbi:MAG TPA: hypothetical protein VD993_11155 [Chitinophagaceae bacterium]|nr:hypothetical protein [Chitinophagaceae bacterium]